MAGHVPVEMLNDAFNVFRDASRKLEEQYAVLETRIEELSGELAEKNRAMERNRRLAAMGEMAARIAHEIRNPLGSMSIFATLLERELSAEPERKKLASHISNGIKTLDNLLTNMLLFAASPEARRKPMDIRDSVEDALGLARGRGKAEVRTSFEGPTEICADHGQLRQLFLNLFINAFDAMEDGGVLTVSARASGDGRAMEIRVGDTGGGIDAESIDRVFDPFYSTKDRGTGLGLAIVSAVVNAHDGSISVESRQGEGTVFTISLPVEREYRV